MIYYLGTKEKNIIKTVKIFIKQYFIIFIELEKMIVIKNLLF